MNNNLQKAIDSLKINDVFLKSSRTFLAKGFEPKFEKELKLRGKHLVLDSYIMEVKTHDEEIVKLFRVGLDLGIVWCLPQEPEPACALIEATYISEYIMEQDVDDSALGEFASKNASYHVWPYWREFVANQCNRMNLEKVILPMVQFAKKGSKKNEESHIEKGSGE